MPEREPGRELYFDWSSAYGCVHTDARNRLSKDRTKKLVKVYFNCLALEKAQKVEWELQAFIWDESEPLADSESDEFFSETPDLTLVLTCANSNLLTPNHNRQTPNRNRGGHWLAGKCNPALMTQGRTARPSASAVCRNSGCIPCVKRTRVVVPGPGGTATRTILFPKR